MSFMNLFIFSVASMYFPASFIMQYSGNCFPQAKRVIIFYVNWILFHSVIFFYKLMYPVAGFIVNKKAELYYSAFLCSLLLV
jgi:hypothetical protein